MEQKRPVIRISVRNLVEFILREGDIDNRVGTKTDAEAMQLGSRIHRKIQKSMGSNYQAEVSLKTEYDCGDFLLRIEGRADGIITEEIPMIDEIKGILSDIHKIEEPKAVHLAQAKCYAWIYGTQNTCSQMAVQMTYCQMETEEIRRFQSVYQMEELEEWFFSIVKEYEKWARFQVEWKEKRNQSIKKLKFPFSYRKGQKELVTSVYRTILRKKKLFIQAPTGVGKTLATLFPAVKGVGEGLGDKIFYLTAKTITRTVAEQAFNKMKEQDLQYKVVTLTAKEKICFCDETECNPDYCPYAKGHLDRVNDAVFHLLQEEDGINRETIERYAKEYKVCPFEMALDASLWVDAIICDYNYVFDPNAQLKRFFAEGVTGDHLFLIDEAHNLVERGREMYSAQIYKEDFLELKRLVKTKNPVLAKKLEVCNKLLLQLKKECENYEVIDNISHIYLKLLNLMGEMEDYLDECEEKEIKEKVLDLYFNVRMFVETYEKLDENYVIYTEYQEDGRFALKLFCVNPSTNLQRCLDKGNSTIFFSATLLPIQYYKSLLSTENDNYAIYAESTFDTNKRLLLNGIDVSTKYTRRTADMYQKYARYFVDAMKAKKGNYMAFFPSYRFMEMVKEVFDEINEDDKIECVMQKQYMTEADREEFLETFERENEKSLLGFCVMGGIFSEGIDLTEEKLIGAFVVGTGLPQVCNEREILKNYFEQKGLRGFDYAYLYPGINKVLQSAGRVIRTEKDQGIILLLDDRFREPRCQETFPREWKDCQRCTLQTVENQVKKFWENLE